MIADPAKDILKNLKPEVTAKDKEDNAKVKADAKAKRQTDWKRPSSKKERDDLRTERMKPFVVTAVEEKPKDEKEVKPK